MTSDRKREVKVRPAGGIDGAALRRHVVQAWGGESLVAHGERIYPERLLGFVALEGDRIVGHVSYRIVGERREITSIEAMPRNAGVGTRRRSRGVVIEEYDLPGVKTENGIANMGFAWIGWIVDPGKNVLAIFQRKS